MDVTELARKLRPVFDLYPELAVVYLFGSAARGEERSDSDIDLGLVFRGRGETALHHHRMLGDLGSRLEGPLEGRRVDLVVLEGQGPIFCHRVLCEAKLLYEGDPERRVDFESDTCVRALDFRPTYEIAAREHLNGVRRRLKSQR